MMPLKKVLLIEDDVEDQQLFMEALNTLEIGVHCKTVMNGREALEHLDAVSNYELIFLDLNMPTMNGLDCLKALKLHAKFKDIPVVIYSTSNNKAELQACTTSGAFAFVQKPDAFTVLCSELNNILVSNN